MKIFLDTNIFLDLILKRENSKESLIILNAIQEGIFEGFVLDITLLNIDYIAKKQVKNIRDFLTLINDTFSVIGATNEAIFKALNIQNNDLEDNIQFICAKNCSCDAIITNDKSFYREDIQTLSSNEFIDKFMLRKT